MEDYEKTQASIKLLAELAKGQKAGETSDHGSAGWESIESVEAAFRYHRFSAFLLSQPQQNTSIKLDKIPQRG